MAGEVKKGAPRTGLYFRFRTGDMETNFLKLRQAFMVINRSDYEKNMHVLEIIISENNQRNFEAAALLKEIGQSAGIVVLVQNDIDAARRLEVDGVMLDKIADLPVAKAAFEDHQIIGVRCANNKDIAQQALSANADFISFGSGKFLPDVKLVSWWSAQSEKPLLIEGDVTSEDAGAGFLDVTEYVFKHPQGALQGAVNVMYAIDLASGGGADQKPN